MTWPRVVIGTDALASALLLRSEPLAWLRGAWQKDSIRPLASRETTGELIRVLAWPGFGLTEEDREQLLADYLPWCETVTDTDPPAVPDCRDPFDRTLLELALAARADAIVAGDNELLSLQSPFSIPIMTPAAFRERLVEVTR